MDVLGNIRRWASWLITRGNHSNAVYNILKYMYTCNFVYIDKLYIYINPVFLECNHMLYIYIHIHIYTYIHIYIYMLYIYYITDMIAWSYPIYPMNKSQVDTASDGLSSISEGDLSEGNGWGGRVFGGLRSLKDWDSIGFNGSLMGFNGAVVGFNGTLVGFSGFFFGI